MLPVCNRVRFRKMQMPLNAAAPGSDCEGAVGSPSWKPLLQQWQHYASHRARQGSATPCSISGRLGVSGIVMAHKGVRPSEWSQERPAGRTAGWEHLSSKVQSLKPNWRTNQGSEVQK